MVKRKILSAAVFFAVVAVLNVCVTYAQSMEVAAQASAGVANETLAPTPSAPAPVIDESVFAASLFFTPLELIAIQKALAGNVVGTAVLNNQNPVVIPAKRSIVLAGVVYKAPEKWIIWLNGQKVTPQSLLPEIMDIQVEQDRVHLKWFDIGINNVISLTLRPHQTYDIVTGVLLPGQ